MFVEVVLGKGRLVHVRLFYERLGQFIPGLAKVDLFVPR